MKHLITFLAGLACAAAAPGYILAQEPDYVHLPLGKSTFTSSSQAVDHGSTHVIHPVPVLHAAPLVHVPMSVSSQSHARTAYHAPSSKTTVTNSKQIVNHGSTAVYQAAVPLHSSPLVYESPAVAYRSQDVAVAHHATVPVLNPLPLYALH